MGKTHVLKLCDYKSLRDKFPFLSYSVINVNEENDLLKIYVVMCVCLCVCVCVVCVCVCVYCVFCLTCVCVCGCVH